MSTLAKGSFQVKMTPQGDGDTRSGVATGRLALDKQYEGDLVGTGRGEMLTAMGAVQGSAGYVAIERVSGTLHGRAGSFVLQHSATMTRGAPQLSIGVVPDSGTEALAGIAGSLQIVIEGGAHFYRFDYTLPT